MPRLYGPPPSLAECAVYATVLLVDEEYDMLPASWDRDRAADALAALRKADESGDADAIGVATTAADDFAAAWSASTTYAAGSLVRHGYELWVSLASSENVEPSASASQWDRYGMLRTSYRQSVRSRYSVQWYREGAIEAARRFRAWCASEFGVSAADRGVDLSEGSARQSVWTPLVPDAAWEPFAVCMLGTIRRMDAIMPTVVKEMSLPEKESWVEERAQLDLAVRWGYSWDEDVQSVAGARVEAKVADRPAPPDGDAVEEVGLDFVLDGTAEGLESAVKDYDTGEG